MVRLGLWRHHRVGVERADYSPAIWYWNGPLLAGTMIQIRAVGRRERMRELVVFDLTCLKRRMSKAVESALRQKDPSRALVEDAWKAKRKERCDGLGCERRSEAGRPTESEVDGEPAAGSDATKQGPRLNEGTAICVQS